MFDFDITIYFASFISIASVHFAAVMSPGPDVALTIRNSLLHSRFVGLAGALGTTTGIAIHLTYTVFGIGYIVTQMPWLMTAIRLAGAAYLLYLGYMAFKSDGTMGDVTVSDEAPNAPPLTPWKAYRIGVVNNLLNPMVIIFFLSILSDYIGADTPLIVQGLYGVMIISITFLWFAFVAIFFAVDGIRAQFLKMGKWLERLTGAALVAFGLKVFYTAGRAF